MSVSNESVVRRHGRATAIRQNFRHVGLYARRDDTVEIHKGQLVVDVIDAKQKKLIWRGMAKDKLSDKKNELLDQVHSAVEKMFQQYPIKPKS